MWITLVLYHFPLLRVPGISPHTRGFVDWHPGVIADFGPWIISFGRILVKLLVPISGQINLPECRVTNQGKRYQQKRSKNAPWVWKIHRNPFSIGGKRKTYITRRIAVKIFLDGVFHVGDISWGGS
jgi:hypothetical protein